MTDRRLTGKTAVITGAGSGMGRAAAELFAREGCRVLALDRDYESVTALSEAASRNGPLDGSIVAFQCDVTQENEVRTAITEAIERFGPISIAYNNAGIDLAAGAGDTVSHELDATAFDLTLSVNLRGMYLVSKYVVPSMLQLRFGSIINTASVSGPLLGSSQHAYASSKGGVVGLTRALALSYAEYNIRANVICPGVIETPMVDFVMRGETSSARYRDATPMKRFGKPEEVARLALFLASEESSYITGAMITIDGGLSIN